MHGHAFTVGREPMISYAQENEDTDARPTGSSSCLLTRTTFVFTLINVCVSDTESISQKERHYM